MKINQCIYITGGSSGIGLSLANRYAQDGDDVNLPARNQNKLDDAVTSCKTVAGGAQQVIAGVSLDVSDIKNLQADMDIITAEYGQPDLSLATGSTSASGFLGVFIPGVGELTLITRSTLYNTCQTYTSQ